MERRSGLSVVIPTYNERENIKILVGKILNVFEDKSIDGEIIFVDDHSNDGSYEILREMQSKIDCVSVIFRAAPRNLARSFIEGFRRASKKNIVCIDGDLSHDPKYFPLMLEKMDVYDIVIGSRYLGNKFQIMEDKSGLATYLSVFSQFLTRMATGFRESDISHSFRMFKKDCFVKIDRELTQQGNVFLIEFLYLAKKHGARVTEIPIEYGKRMYGETKLKIGREGLRYLRFMARLLLKRFGA